MAFPDEWPGQLAIGFFIVFMFCMLVCLIHRLINDCRRRGWRMACNHFCDCEIFHLHEQNQYLLNI